MGAQIKLNLKNRQNCKKKVSEENSKIFQKC